MNKPAPIALFAFNRLDHLKRTLDALAANTLATQSHVTIFCDGPRNEMESLQTDEVRAAAHKALGFASVRVIEREKNYGCARSVIDGLQCMFSIYDRVIVIEDDIVCSPHTLEFLNAGLDRYERRKVIFSIAAWSPPYKLFPVSKEYPYDVYAIPRFNCWGWASWRDRFDFMDWDIADYGIFKNSPTLRKAFDKGGEDLCGMLDAQLEKKIDSWAIRVNYNLFKRGCVSIGPVHSYTINIGMKCGTHGSEESTSFQNDINSAIPEKKIRWIDHIFVDDKVQKQFTHIYKRDNKFFCAVRVFLKKMGLLLFARWVKQKLKKIYC